MVNNKPLNIIYKEPTFIVVDKPSGLLSVPGRTPDMQDCVVNRLRSMIPESIAQPSVHRLDMDTSGLLVLALTEKSHRNLSIQFQTGKVKKRYIAILDGVIEGESGTIKLPFRLDPENRPHQVYDEVHGKWGITHWEKLKTEGNRTCISFVPITGRTHQLRLHASHEKGLNTPITGDRLYGNGSKPGQMKLHACYLCFKNPETRRSIHFESAPPFLQTL